MLRWTRNKKEGGPESDPADPPKQAAAQPAAAKASGARAPKVSDSGIRRQSLADLLLSQGQVTEEQLKQALETQKATGAFIGEVLIEQGVLDEKSLISFLAKHCKIPHLSLLDYLIDKDIVTLVPQEICLKYRLLPIDKMGSNLTVAMVNPLHGEALKKVQECCPDLRIKPILCAHNHFETVTQKIFAGTGSSGPGGYWSGAAGQTHYRQSGPGRCRQGGLALRSCHRRRHSRRYGGVADRRHRRFRRFGRISARRRD